MSSKGKLVRGGGRKGATRRQAVDFVVLVYRMPPTPTAGPVAVWRLLEKIGAIYLQQSVCVFPNTPVVRAELDPVLVRIESSDGAYHLLPLDARSDEEESKLITEFQHQTARHYAEIVENCQVNFQKEIQFETFRKNFTYGEAEESEYEKICAWFDRVRERDWFGAPGQGQAATWIRRCRQALETFEAEVYRRQPGNAQRAPRHRRAAKTVSRRKRTTGSRRPTGGWLSR